MDDARGLTIDGPASSSIAETSSGSDSGSEGGSSSGDSDNGSRGRGACDPADGAESAQTDLSEERPQPPAPPPAAQPQPRPPPGPPPGPPPQLRPDAQQRSRPPPDLQPVPPPNTPIYMPAAEIDGDVEAEEKRRREGNTAFALYQSVGDDSKKLGFLRRAGERGHLEAQYQLRYFCETEDECREWHKKSCNAGHPFSNYDSWITLTDRGDVAQAHGANQLLKGKFTNTKKLFVFYKFYFTLKSAVDSH